MKLNEQPDAIAALTAAVGPSIGYFISECAHGGYIVYVDGGIHCARSTLHEAITAMGDVAASRYGQSATAPEHAVVVKPWSGRVEDDPELDGAADAAAAYGPRSPTMRSPREDYLSRGMAQMRRAAQVLFLALVIGGAAVWRGAT